jgi:hypothetical protein
MFKENTGRHMLDSGGAYGRNWERNATVSLDDAPEITIDELREGDTIEDICFSVDCYKFLTTVLELDEVCDTFNALQDKCAVEGDDYGDAYYGVYSQAECMLEQYDIGKAWNTYNGENNLSQVLQGNNVEIDGEQYVLLQVHGGCDVRGGYTDAKLFKMDEYLTSCPDIYGTITMPDGKEIELNGSYPYIEACIRDADGNEEKIEKDYSLPVECKIEMYLASH